MTMAVNKLIGANHVEHFSGRKVVLIDMDSGVVVGDNVVAVYEDLLPEEARQSGKDIQKAVREHGMFVFVSVPSSKEA
jgi:hypothetical protein